MVIKKNVLQASVLFVFIVFANGLMGMEVKPQSTHYTFRSSSDCSTHVCGYDGQIDQLIKKYIKVNKDNTIDCSYANFNQFSELLINIQSAQNKDNDNVDDNVFVKNVVATYKYLSLRQVFEISSVLKDNKIRSAIEKEVQVMTPKLKFVEQLEKPLVPDNNFGIKIPLRGSAAFFLKTAGSNEPVYLVIDKKVIQLKDLTICDANYMKSTELAARFSLSPDSTILIFHAQGMDTLGGSPTKIFRTSDGTSIGQFRYCSSGNVYFCGHEILIETLKMKEMVNYHLFGIYQHKLLGDYTIDASKADRLCNMIEEQDKDTTISVDNSWTIKAKDYVFCSSKTLVYFDCDGKAHCFDIESKEEKDNVFFNKVFTKLHRVNEKFCLLQDDHERLYCYNIKNNSSDYFADANINEEFKFLVHPTADILYFVNQDKKCVVYDTVQKKLVKIIELNQNDGDISIDIDPTHKFIVVRSGDTVHFANAYTGEKIDSLRLPQGALINYDAYGFIGICNNNEKLVLGLTYKNLEDNYNLQSMVDEALKKKSVDETTSVSSNPNPNHSWFKTFSILLSRHKYPIAIGIGCLSALYAWFHWYK